jgi:hypothetical protein
VVGEETRGVARRRGEEIWKRDLPEVVVSWVAITLSSTPMNSAAFSASANPRRSCSILVSDEPVYRPVMMHMKNQHAMTGRSSW